MAGMLWGVAGWARPVSDKLGPEAGWAALAGGLLVRLSLSLVSSWPAHFRQKWTHGAGQDFGPADMGGGGGGGGGPAKFWLEGGGGEKRRDLSALGPFGPRRIDGGPSCSL